MLCEFIITKEYIKMSTGKQYAIVLCRKGKSQASGGHMQGLSFHFLCFACRGISVSFQIRKEPHKAKIAATAVRLALLQPAIDK